MAVQLRAVPTYGRDIYVIPLGRADFAPPDFGLDDRLLLMRGMASSAPEVDQHSWARALESLEVATVCTTSLVEPRLLAAVEQGYSSLGSAGACRDIWVRG